MIEKGKIYMCLVCPYDNFTEGKEYYAIDANIIFDDYGVRVMIDDDACKFTEVKSAQLPAKLIQTAKSECEKKILDAISEFEKSTGFNIKDVDINSIGIRDDAGLMCCSKYVTIIISL